MDAPLTAVIRGLEPVLRRHVSDIGFRFMGDRAEVSIRFALYVEGGVIDDENPWVIQPRVHPGEPEPVRWPTLVRAIPLTPSAREQVADLEQSGLLGVLRGVPHRSGHDFSGLVPRRTWGSAAAATWRLLTHGGSVEERRSWLGSLRESAATTDAG